MLTTPWNRQLDVCRGEAQIPGSAIHGRLEQERLESLVRIAGKDGGRGEGCWGRLTSVYIVATNKEVRGK